MQIEHSVVIKRPLAEVDACLADISRDKIKNHRALLERRS